MSRIGKKPVSLPAGVEVNVDEAGVIHVKGPKGELTQPLDSRISIDISGGEAVLTRSGDDREARSQHGLMRALLANMVTGVTDGFQKKLIVEGVGYRVEKNGKTLVMHLGFSHSVSMDDPEGIETETPDGNTIIVKGIDNALVGNYAAIIRSYREPEPYKGKGIRYDGEHIRRKEGKAGAK